MSEPSDASRRDPRPLVLIPTYNERENLPLVVQRVRLSVPSVDILVLDDNSPDGTGEIADALAAADPQVHVMHRAGKQGLGAAYKAGFAWAIERDYDAAVEMDADGSHQPEQLPALLAAAELGAVFCSVDVVDSEAGREVLEVNSGVMLERLATESPAWWHRAEAVYESALLLALDP